MIKSIIQSISKSISATRLAEVGKFSEAKAIMLKGCS
tara:strand:+ start:368 stop:478 length:111 start_codon:yes stop_codon:yes gene_type:complete